MFLIDGYNLLYQTDFETNQELISALEKYCQVYGKKATIFFDGYSPDDLSVRRVEVYFTGDADKGLIDFMQESNRPGDVLISSDREIRRRAREKNLRMIKSEDFNFTVPKEEETGPEEDPNLELSDQEMAEQMKEFGWSDN